MNKVLAFLPKTLWHSLLLEIPSRSSTGEPLKLKVGQEREPETFGLSHVDFTVTTAPAFVSTQLARSPVHVTS